MVMQQISAAQSRQVLSGTERLALRVSAMINHPVAQTQRWVRIHRLDSDLESDWEQVMEVLVAIDELDLQFNDDDSVTLRWDGPGDHDQVVTENEIEMACAPPPF